MQRSYVSSDSGQGSNHGRGLTLQPESPDRPGDESLERADGLPAALPLSDASIQVCSCLFGMMGLGEGDPIDDCVQLAVPAAIEAVTNQPC